MARTASPWYWEERGGWYVTKDGQRHYLGAHPTDAPPPRKTKTKWNTPPSIAQKFYELMAQRPTPILPLTAPPLLLSVAALLEKYLAWCQKNRAPRTYDGYQWHLSNFINALPHPTELPAIDLKPFHVQEWLDLHPNWGATYRSNATAAVKRAYAWAQEMGHLPVNPVQKIKRPASDKREDFIAPETWQNICGQYSDAHPFREFLEFLWETGCRPFEARTIEPRHVNLSKALIAIPPPEAKGKKRWRLIRLEGTALTVVQRRLNATQSHLFLNSDGLPWTSDAINCAFCRLKEKLGVKYCAYQFRHGFANRMLVSKVDHLTVAELMGHADGSMLAKVYAHMDQADDHLRDALRKAQAAQPTAAPPR